MPLGKAASLPGFGQDAWDSHAKGSPSSVWWSVLTKCGCCWMGHPLSLLLLQALRPLVMLPSFPSPKPSKSGFAPVSCDQTGCNNGYQIKSN